MKEDINIHTVRCKECQKNKRPTVSPKGKLGSMLVGAPIDRLCIDIIGPLPMTPSKNRYILTVTDHFTNWAEAFGVPDQTALAVTRKLFNEVLSRLGCPTSIHSDQGTNFESQLFHEMCQLLQIKKTHTSPRHPQDNGKTERFNRTLISMVKCFIKDEETRWDRHISFVTAAYRSSVHEATGMTPNFLMLGREPRMPLDMIFEESKTNQVCSQEDYVLELKRKLEKAHDIARSKLKKTFQRQQENYDKHVRPFIYKAGDKVLYLQERIGDGKFTSTYNGPYEVTKKLSDLSYQIRMKNEEGKRQYKIVHHNKLKPYY